MGADFDPAEILRVLEAEGVQYVLVGGLAAAVHGSPYVTSDVDITPARDRANLDRLSRALDALQARIRTESEPDGLPFAHDGESLARATVWNLVTRAGDLDLTIVPSGTHGYDDLVDGAESIEILGLAVPVASLADVIRSKEAANRQKDRLQLPLLRKLLDESG